jgi:acyl-CoA thioesterase-1
MTACLVNSTLSQVGRLTPAVLVVFVCMIAGRPVLAQGDQFSTSARGGTEVADARAWWASRTGHSDEFRTQTTHCLSLLDRAEGHRQTAMRYKVQAKTPGPMASAERTRLNRLGNEEYAIVTSLVRKFYECARPLSDQISTGRTGRPQPVPRQSQPDRPDRTDRPDRIDTDGDEPPQRAPVRPQRPRGDPDPRPGGDEAPSASPVPQRGRLIASNPTRRSAPGPAARPATGLIVVLGDSLAVKPNPPGAFPSILQAALRQSGPGWLVINASAEGRTTADAVAALPGVLARRPQILIVEVGNNDGLKKVPLATYRRNLTTIVSRAAAQGARVLVCEARIDEGLATMILGESDPYITGFNDVSRAVAAQHKVPLVPSLLDDIAGDPSLTMRDLVHPNAAGAKVIAIRVWKSLSPLLRGAR